MGYLNTQLKKVASTIESEMEKQALSLKDLLRMANVAKKSGKFKRFEELINKRNAAIQKVKGKRWQSLLDDVYVGKLPREELGTKLNTHVPGYAQQTNAEKTLQALMVNKRIPDLPLNGKVAFEPINADTLARANLKAQSLSDAQVKNLHEKLIKEMDDYTFKRFR